MKKSNQFKSRVIDEALKANLGTHPEIVASIEATFEFYPEINSEEEYRAESYYCVVGEWSFTGNEFGQNSRWPSKTSNGSIADTALIIYF